MVHQKLSQRKGACQEAILKEDEKIELRQIPQEHWQSVAAGFREC